MHPILRVILILEAAALPASPLPAQNTTGQSPSDSSTIIVKGQKEKKVCKTFDAPTGSRVGERRVCRTEAEWRLAEATAQRNMDRENQRFEANRAQLENEKNALAKPLPH